MSDLDDTSDDDQTDPSVTLPRGSAAFRGSTLPPIPPRPPSLPARPRLTPPPLPSMRAKSIPPASLPRPSDPPRVDVGAAQRQRLAQLETQLEQARAAIGRMESELAEVRARAEKASALAAREVDRAEPLEPRVAALEERGAALETALKQLEGERAIPDPSEHEARVAKVEERVRALEEHEGEARIRMRLERATHRLDELERRIGALESAQHAASEAAAQASEREERLSRLESLFEELADEVRAERDTRDLEGLRARLEDVEALVVSAGSRDVALERTLDEHARALESLRQTLPSEPEGDDLTRIKGIGPKYARLLREHGTTTFAQIATWTDEDLERAAEALGIPAGRIRKAGWVEAAARLSA